MPDERFRPLGRRERNLFRDAIVGQPTKVVDTRTPQFEEARRNVSGAELLYYASNKTITPGVSYHWKVEEFIDLAAKYEAWQTSDDRVKVRCDKYEEEIICQSTVPFIVSFWIAVAESGKSFSTQEGAQSSSGVHYPTKIMDGFSTTEVDLDCLATLRAIPVPIDGSNQDWKVRAHLDLKPIVFKWLAHAERAVFNGDPLPEVKLLAMVHCNTTNTAVNITGFRIWHTYEVAR